ncbi:hypothetical protein [Demequina lignilytica]|uniref:Uncharacterized protein n=1 Tax=Demequina lignilytica TaxID=3051663 RepID=A0AB35MGF0_9MICO|nr:hypothetical protein [Demequina sp. SYSU T0a273]MDN4482837.1 hypothetical protein [Demequina sp. SYSU T0a273]
MNSTVLRLGVVTGAAALLLLGVGVAATAVARAADPADPDTVATAEDGTLLQDDAAIPDDAGPGGAEQLGEVPSDGFDRDGDGGRGGHRAGPPSGDALAVPPEEQRWREEGEGSDSVPDGGAAGGEASEDDSADTPTLID